MGDYRKLITYQKAFDLAMEIFTITKKFLRKKNIAWLTK